MSTDNSNSGNNSGNGNNNPTETTPPLSINLKHFVRIARSRHHGASSGEKAARSLAILMLDEGLILDDSAIEGFIEFVRGAKAAPESARTLVDGWD